MGLISVPDPPCGGAPCADLLRNLAAAAEHRDVVGVAKGLLMAATDCGADAAFDLLRTESQHRNVKLWQVAEGIVREHDARLAM